MLPRPEWRRAEIYGSIPDMWGTQMLRVVLQGREEPAVVTEPGRGIAQAIVISGLEAIGELTGGESFDTLIETPWETFEEQVSVALGVDDGLNPRLFAFLGARDLGGGVVDGFMFPMN